VMLIGILLADSSRRVAVTTISCRLGPSDSAATPAVCAMALPQVAPAAAAAAPASHRQPQLTGDRIGCTGLLVLALMTLSPVRSIAEKARLRGPRYIPI